MSIVRNVLPSLVRKRLVVPAALGLLALASASYANAGTGNYLYMQSDNGDYIGQSDVYWYTGQSGSWSPSANTGYFYNAFHTPGYEHWWYTTFASISGQPLVPGTYVDAQRYPFQDATHPGMDISGDGRGCNTLSGRFTVLTADFTGNTVNHFRATFEQHCEGMTPALHGEIGINVTVPPAPPKGSISIDKGAVATNKTSAYLSATGTNIDKIRYSTDGVLDTELFQRYAGGSLPITLPAGEGGKTVIAQFQNSAGFLSGQVADQILLDQTPPTDARFLVPSTCCTAVVKGNPFTLSWTASDAFSGIGSYTLAYTRAPYDGPFGTSTPWLTGTTATKKSFTGIPGGQYCFTVAAKDKAGNVSPKGKGCYVLPLDDPALTAETAGWTSANASGYYLGTYRQSTSDGDSLVSPTVQARRIGVVFAKCPGCGTITVELNGVVIGTIKTAGTTTQLKQFTYLPAFSTVREGVVRLVAGGGGPVTIDGLALSRY